GDARGARDLRHARGVPVPRSHRHRAAQDPRPGRGSQHDHAARPRRAGHQHDVLAGGAVHRLGEHRRAPVSARPSARAVPDRSHRAEVEGPRGDPRGPSTCRARAGSVLASGCYFFAAAFFFLGARESVNLLYAAHTSSAPPSITSLPSCTHSTRVHMLLIVFSEWLTRNTVPAASRTSSIFAFDFARNAASPVARAASIMRMSGTAEAEIAKRSRAP